MRIKIDVHGIHTKEYKRRSSATKYLLKMLGRSLRLKVYRLVDGEWQRMLHYQVTDREGDHQGWIRFADDGSFTFDETLRHHAEN